MKPRPMPVELSAGSAGTAPSNPVVSVCMTTYNHAPYLAQAIEGVLAQRTSFDVELVLSDDCSTDGTATVCADYAGRYPDRIRLVTGAENVGMRANYRRTIEACRGTYVAMCDGDDYWSDPLKLQKQVDMMVADPACGICYTRVWCYSQVERRDTEIFPAGEAATTFDGLLRGNTIPNCSVLVRRDLLLAYYMDPDLRPLEHDWPLEDYPMWLWMSQRCEVRFLDLVTSVFRVLPDSGSHQSSPMSRKRYDDAVFGIRVWFDTHYNGGCLRNFLHRWQLEYMLAEMYLPGVRSYFRYWFQTVCAAPRLMFWRRGYKLLFKVCAVRFHLCEGKR